MAARADVPPWQRGGTYASGDTTISDAANVALYGTGGAHLEGRVFVFEPNADAGAITYSSIGADPSGRQTTVKVVRNKSGAALKPGRIVHYAETGTGLPYEAWVDGYCTDVADRPAGVVDDFLGPNGVPDGDLFYIVVDGPTRVVNIYDVGPAVPGNFVVGDVLVPAVYGSTRTDDLGGRVAEQDLSGATTALGNNLQNRIGYADAVNNAFDHYGTVLFKAIVHLYSDRD